MDPIHSYPNFCHVNGELYQLKSESPWLRKYVSPSGKFHIVSRLRDLSFNRALFTELDILKLSEKERDEASLAIAVSGNKNLPPAWITMMQSWKERQNALYAKYLERKMRNRLEKRAPDKRDAPAGL